MHLWEEMKKSMKSLDNRFQQIVNALMISNEKVYEILR